LFEVAFGLLPRQYLPTPEDRYIIREEDDVSEITFVYFGEWAVGFSIFTGEAI